MKWRIIDWWKWIRRDGWELVELTPTDYAGIMPTEMRPYFFETWLNHETGERRTISKL